MSPSVLAFFVGSRCAYVQQWFLNEIRYLAELDLPLQSPRQAGWSDKTRVDAIWEGIEGKRLTYRRPNGAKEARQALDG
jgi:hypothetical protein